MSGLQGFAALPEDQHRAVSSLGGKTAQAKGTARRWNHEEAVAAGRKGAAARLAKAYPPAFKKKAMDVLRRASACPDGIVHVGHSQVARTLLAHGYVVRLGREDVQVTPAGLAYLRGLTERTSLGPFTPR